MAAFLSEHDVCVRVYTEHDLRNLEVLWRSALKGVFEECGLPIANPPPLVGSDFCLVVAFNVSRGSATDECRGVAVARMSGEMLGSNTREAHISALAVRPAYHRRGLGQKLWNVIHRACFHEAQCSLARQEVTTSGTKVLEIHPGIRVGEAVSSTFALLAFLNGHALGAYGVPPCPHTPTQNLDESQLRAMLKVEAPLVTLLVRTAAPVYVSLTKPYLSPRPVTSNLCAVDFAGRASNPSEYLTSQGLDVSKNTQLSTASLGLPILRGGKCTSTLTGCCHLVVNEDVCFSLEKYIEERANYQLRAVKGGHHSCLRVGPKIALSGYDEYASLNSAHYPQLQADCTKKTYNLAAVSACLKHLPGLREIAEEALKHLGVVADSIMTWLQEYLKAIHLLQSDWSNQTSFGWHTDHTDVNVSLADAQEMVSIIVQLSSAAITGMQIHGFQQAVYEGRGSGLAFHGCAVHRSTPTHPRVHSYAPSLRVHKVVLFFVPKKLK